MDKRTLNTAILSVLIFTFILWINNSVPFIQAPSFGLILWESGFAQSIANHSLLFPFATDFGLPEPAPIAFGLPAVWPMSVFIRLGFAPVDAYTLVNACWLGVAFWGTYSLCRWWKVPSYLAGLGAAVWLSLPMVWAHQHGYGALALGFALLPTYFYIAVRFFDLSCMPISWYALFYPAATIVALFMDGYSFVMFAVASSGIACLAFVRHRLNRQILFRFSWHFVSFGAAYALYKIYVGAMPLPHFPQAVFHAWGLDLRFWLIPQEGLLWFADMLGISEVRNTQHYWGDASIQWSYYLPLVFSGAWAFWKNRRRHMAFLLGLLAVFSFWMSLGPVLKINDLQIGASIIPPVTVDGYCPTGNYFFSSMPGFATMRAAYRWGALCAMALWGLLILEIGRCQRRKLSTCLLLILIIFSLPSSLGKSGLSLRTSMLNFDHDIIPLCQEHIQSNERIAVIPRYNDFVVNYIAARTPFKTYNIGGDKNISFASEHWPEALRSLPPSHFYSNRILYLFANKEADAVLIPFFYTVNMSWPLQEKDWYADRNRWVDSMRTLVHEGYVYIEETPYFAVVRPSYSFSSKDYTEIYAKIMQENFSFPVVPDTQQQIVGIFLTGWHNSEGTHIWSEKIAVLRLPKKDKSCGIRLTFSVYDASPEHPKAVNFLVGKGEAAIHRELILRDQDIHEIDLKISSSEKKSFVEIYIDVPEAISPLKKKESNDSRILGISLRKIEAISQ